jgi:hypothetical protein
MDHSKFTVTRQHRYYDGYKIVEVSQGGIDYANPDALVKKWQGEFEEFAGMTAAVEAAIGIAKAWQETTTDQIFIGVGATHGMTMEFDALSLNDKTFDALLIKAEKFDENLPKCEHCGDMLTGDNYGHEFSDGHPYCSESCAEAAYNDIIEMNHTN